MVEAELRLRARDSLPLHPRHLWLGLYVVGLLESCSEEWRKCKGHPVESGIFQDLLRDGHYSGTVVLSLSGRLEGPIAAAILSGIGGYVLGQLGKEE